LTPVPGSGLRDPRNRPAVLGSLLLGVGLFVLLWLVLGWSPLLAWMAGWTPVAFAAYGIDKRAAVHGGWRIPEAVLHGLALVGGVIGAWAGRAVFRHKTQKPVFLAVLIIASVLWGAIAILALLGRL
jgi:uncharacterized membrane protein YsdA (DUF1294 family)